MWHRVYLRFDHVILANYPSYYYIIRDKHPIRGPDIFTPNPKTVAVRHIRNLFTKQFPSSLLLADWSPRSPISRQMFAKPFQNNDGIVA